MCFLLVLLNAREEMLWRIAAEGAACLNSELVQRKAHAQYVLWPALRCLALLIISGCSFFLFIFHFLLFRVGHATFNR